MNPVRLHRLDVPQNLCIVKSVVGDSMGAALRVFLSVSTGWSTPQLSRSSSLNPSGFCRWHQPRVVGKTHSLTNNAKLHAEADLNLSLRLRPRISIESSQVASRGC